MHLAVLCLRRRREDQKLILLHAGGVYMSHSGTEVPAGYMALLNHGTSTLLVTTRSTPCYTCTCNISETCRGEVSREMLSYLVYQGL